MTKEVGEIIKWAAEQADKAPEKYRQLAFKELLRYGIDSSKTGKPPDSQSQQKSPNVSQTGSNDDVSSFFSELPKDHIIAKHGTRDQQVAWAVIRLSNQGREAIVNNIMQEIKIHLSITPPNRQATNRSLKTLAPEFLSRGESQDSRGLQYFPNPNILEVFADLVDNAD